MGLEEPILTTFSGGGKFLIVPKKRFKGLVYLVTKSELEALKKGTYIKTSVAKVHRYFKT